MREDPVGAVFMAHRRETLASVLHCLLLHHMTGFETFAEDIARIGGKALLDAVEAEYREGRRVQEALVRAKQQRIATACTTLESAAVDGLGYIESDIPAESYFHWLEEGRKRGTTNIWKHKCFRREFLRDNPQFKVRYKRKIQAGWGRDPLSRAAAEGQRRQAQTLILS